MPCYAQQLQFAKDVEVSPETQHLFEEWQKNGPSEEDRIHDSELKKFLVRSDADLCLAKFAIEAKREAGWWPAITELGKLNTQRSFDLVSPLLKSTDSSMRERGIFAVAEFKARYESVRLLLDILEHDPDDMVRQLAAANLGAFHDARSEAALIHALETDKKGVADSASYALGEMKSAAGVEPAIKRMQRSEGERDLALAIESLRNFRSKAVIEAVLDQYKRTPTVKKRYSDGSPVLTDMVQWAACLVMRECFDATGKTLGPIPDNYYEEWEDWWSSVKPLLTDDLKLTKPLDAKPKQYPDAEFGHDPNDIELHIAVDSPEVRFRDPIRLDLTFKNHSDKPYKVVLPKPPSGWMPTMAYGIRLVRGEEVLMNIEPSDSYVGSYSGQPPFETLGPHQESHSSVCLQYFLEWRIKNPLPEGIYEFQLTFDPRKYAGINPKGVEIVHRWEADAIKFTVAGGERTDPKEIMDVIAQKTGLKFIRNELTSPNYERRERAQHAFYQYSDNRLSDDKSLPEWIRSERYIRH